MKENMSLKSGVFWSAIERFSVQGLHFLMTIVITRFVLPEEFGLVAMLGIFIAISNSIIDSGFSSALIQKQDRNDQDFTVVFYYNIIIALFLYLLLYLTSPFIANFYNEPQLCLLTKIVCISLIITSFNVVPNAKLIIAMDFKSITKVSLISATISGTIGILMAVYGYGVWAIVTQSLIQCFINVLLLWYIVKWVPLWSFSLKSFKRLYGFGSKMMLSGLLHTIYLNLYTLLIGKFFNAQSVGFFNRANSLAQYPSTNLVSIINRVYYPVLCKMQNDSKTFTDIFHSYLRMACYIIFPLSTMLTALADPLIRVLLTEKWAGAIVPLQIIALAYMLYPIMLINNQPLQALNHTTMFLISEIIKKITAVIFLIIALNYSLYVLCLSILVYNICDAIIIVFFTRQIMSTGFRKQILELSPMFFSAILTGGIVYSFVYFMDISRIWLSIGGLFIGILSYTLISKIFKIKEYYIIINLIRNYA